MFSEEIQNFLLVIKYEKRLSPHTVKAYEFDINSFAAYLENQYELKDVKEVKNIHIRSWLAYLKDGKNSDRTLKRKFSSIKSFFLYLLRNNKIRETPIKQSFYPKKTKTIPDYLEVEQTDQLKDSVVFENSFEGLTKRLIIELLYQTGMRRSELINLKEEDINFEKREILIFGKGNKERIVPISPNLSLEIQSYLKIKREMFEHSNIYLLSLKSGKQLYPEFVYRVVKKYLNEVTTAGKKSPHVLRHTFATHLLNGGADLIAIKELLGHSSLAATQIYTHVNIEKLKEIYKKSHPKS